MSRFNQNGDTIVEVIFALVILSAVLVGALALARFSRVNSENSQLRTQTINAVQEQYEALREFRDDNTWAAFVKGNPPNLHGIQIATSGGSCNPAVMPDSACIFHMERDPRPSSPTYSQWIPCQGAWHPPLDYDTTWSANPATFCNQPNASTSVKVSIEPFVNPICDGTEYYQFNFIGSWAEGGDVASSSTTLETLLANIKGQAAC